MTDAECTFCLIVAGQLPSRVRYEDSDIIVFDNRLRWLPVMLLLVPRAHMTQAEMWSDAAVLSRIGQVAVRLGQEHCPDGFRLLSNIGEDALQTQPHAHLHLLGGARYGTIRAGHGRSMSTAATGACGSPERVSPLEWGLGEYSPNYLVAAPTSIHYTEAHPARVAAQPRAAQTRRSRQ